MQRYHYIRGEVIPIDQNEEYEISRNLAIRALEDKLDIERAKRANCYWKDGDVLDALLKQWNYERMAKGRDFIQEVDALLNHWLDVKRDIPLDEIKDQINTLRQKV